MKRLVLGIAAVLAVAAHTAARAEDQTGADTPPRAIAVSSEAQDAAVKPAASEGAVAKVGEAAPETSATMLMATALATELATPPLPPPITLTLKVDLRAQNVTVLEKDAVKYVWPVSSGREGYATQTGTFQPTWTSRMWYSRQWDMAPMPHAVFFNRGTAFHATSATGSLGRRASHGCIRLAPGNAAKLYAMVHRHGLASTRVIVHSAPKEPAVAQRKNNRSNEQASARRRGYQGYYANRSGYGSYGSAWGF